jgi:hypothetical protein
MTAARPRLPSKPKILARVAALRARRWPETARLGQPDAGGQRRRLHRASAPGRQVALVIVPQAAAAVEYPWRHAAGECRATGRRRRLTAQRRPQRPVAVREAKP